MAYDEILLARIRGLLLGRAGLDERRMFGGVAFLAHGHMFVGITDKALMARVGPAAYAAALAKPYVRVMDFTGKPMRGYVFVDPPGVQDDGQLLAWLEDCLGFVASLPAKVAVPKKR